MRLISLFLLVFLISCGNSPEIDTDLPENDLNDSTEFVEFELDEKRLSAVEFNNELSITLESSVSAVDVLFSSDSSSIDMNLENAVFEMQMNLDKLNNLEIVGTGEAFKNAVIALLEFYQSEFTGGFKSIVPFIKTIELSSLEEAELDDYDYNFALKERELSETISTEQDAYAAANNIRLE